MEQYKALFLNDDDNISIALSEIPKGASIQLKNGDISIMLLDTIHFGHKFSTRFIQKNEEIKKYGEVIGVATKDIQPGEHVHVHNIVSKRSDR